MRSAALTGVLALGLAGCVDGDYNRRRVFQPLADAEVDALVVGRTDVGAAVERLGAPVYVIELGLGLALAWGWQDVTDWNVELSAPIGDAQGNFSFTSTDTTTRGVVLFFDRDWVLLGTRRGFLANLLPERQPPRDVDIDLGQKPRIHPPSVEDLRR